MKARIESISELPTRAVLGAIAAAMFVGCLAQAAPVEAACPNEAVRALQYTTGLAECRAYEMVSPVDKNGNDVAGFFTVQASPDGSGVVFGSTGAFAGAESAPAQNTYLARRGADGWTTRAASPPQLNRGIVMGGITRDFSADLSSSVTFSQLALAPGSIAGDTNIYMRDNFTSALKYVGGTPEPYFYTAATNTGEAVVYGASDNGDFLIAAGAKLTGDAPEGVWKNLYEVSDDGIRLVSVLPNGEPAPEGGVLGDINYGYTSTVNGKDSGVVSADGSRVFFGTLDGNLYERIGGEKTILLTEHQIPSETSVVGQFNRATPDGKVVFFTTSDRLTAEGAPAPSGQATRRLYRYSETGLQLIAEAPPSNSIQEYNAVRVVGTSSDGNTAYFVTNDFLPETPEDEGPKVYRWHQGEGVKEIAKFEPAGQTSELLLPAWWTTSPSGRFAAFLSASLLTPDALPGPECVVSSSFVSSAGRCFEVYVYDAATDQLACASCSPLGVAPFGHSTIGGLFETTASPPRQFTGGYAARGITDDGRVSFDTPSRLNKEDGDGRRDVYEWSNGKITLLTPGTRTDSVYADSSADGSTVYTLTEDRLVSEDSDDSRDIYAIRRDGGFLSQNPSPSAPVCSGETCQGNPTSVPGGPSLGSGSSFSGSGGRARQGGGASRLGIAREVRIKGPSGAVRVTVPGRGTVTVNGRGLVAGAKGRFRDAGKGSVQVALTSRAKERLGRQKRLVVSTRVTWRPSSGPSRSSQTKLIFLSGKGR